MSARLLITGAGGFLGAYLLERSAARFDVIGVYRDVPQNPSSGIAIDLADSEQTLELIKRIRPQVIIHAAANSSVDACERNPQTAMRDNVIATHNVVCAVRQVQARLIFISSDMIFDGRKGCYREDDPPAPLSVYGRSKLKAEQIALDYKNTLIVRSALIYGRSRNDSSSFSDWAEARLTRGEEVPLYTDQFRSPIFVANLAEALLELAESDVKGVLHLAGPDCVSRLLFGETLCRLAGYDPTLLRPVSMPDHQSTAPRPRDLSLNIEKALSILKTPLLGIQQGIKRMLAYPFLHAQHQQ